MRHIAKIIKCILILAAVTVAVPIATAALVAGFVLCAAAAIPVLWILVAQEVLS